MIDLRGQRFGEWEVLEYYKNSKWLCRCSCGIEKLVSAYSLIHGKSRSCGHNSTAFKDLTGKHFGELEVIRFNRQTNKWLCRCSCGEEIEIRAYELTHGVYEDCKKITHEGLIGKHFGDWEVVKYAGNCPNRTEVWRSLKTGETDLSFQFECSEIPARGLRFTPLVYLPELCIPFNQNRPLPPGALSLEEAMCSRWIFANSFEPVLYEEELTREALSRGAEIVRGRDIPCSQYGLPTLMLTPSLFYPRPNLELVRPLGWGSGCRLGIVTRAEPDQMVLQYIQEIQPVIRTHRSQLFGLV